MISGRYFRYTCILHKLYEFALLHKKLKMKIQKFKVTYSFTIFKNLTKNTCYLLRNKTNVDQNLIFSVYYHLSGNENSFTYKYIYIYIYTYIYILCVFNLPLYHKLMIREDKLLILLCGLSDVNRRL